MWQYRVDSFHPRPLTSCQMSWLVRIVRVHGVHLELHCCVRARIKKNYNYLCFLDIRLLYSNLCRLFELHAVAFSKEVWLFSGFYERQTHSHTIEQAICILNINNLKTIVVTGTVIKLIISDALSSSICVFTVFVVTKTVNLTYFWAQTTSHWERRLQIQSAKSLTRIIRLILQL